MAESDPVTVTLSTDDASTDLNVSPRLIEALSEGDESVPAVVADIAMLGLAQQAHGVVHHGHGDPGPELEAAEESTMALFEEHFGQSYAEMTGHSH